MYSRRASAKYARRVFIRGVEFLKIIYVYLQKSNISEEEIRTPRYKTVAAAFTLFT